MKIVETMTKRELNKHAFKLIEEYFTAQKYTLTQEKIKYVKSIYNATKDSENLKLYIRACRFGKNGNYTFVKKKHMALDKNSFVLLVIFLEDFYQVYKIPSIEWKSPNSNLKDKNYKGLKSEPEWGLSVRKRNIENLKKYEIFNGLK